MQLSVFFINDIARQYSLSIIDNELFNVRSKAFHIGVTGSSDPTLVIKDYIARGVGTRLEIFGNGLMDAELSNITFYDLIHPRTLSKF